jgi:hypothetical protein
MSKLIRTIVPPQNAVDITLEDVKAKFGITDPPAEDPPADDPPADDPPADDPPADDPPADSDDPPKDPPKPSVDTKAGRAFAQLRVQNAQYQKTLNGIAKILGVTDTSNPDTLIAQLNKVILEKEAKDKNVPTELLERLQLLEERDKEYSQKQIMEYAYLGFQRVKDMFNLDEAGLQKFADELVAAGINPFETKVDVVREYKLLHFDELMQAAVGQGIKQEQERAAKAANHSTTPNPQKGPGQSGNPEKITTVAQLNDWMNSQSK